MNLHWWKNRMRAIQDIAWGKDLEGASNFKYVYIMDTCNRQCILTYDMLPGRIICHTTTWKTLACMSTYRYFFLCIGSDLRSRKNPSRGIIGNPQNLDVQQQQFCHSLDARSYSCQVLILCSFISINDNDSVGVDLITSITRDKIKSFVDWIVEGVNLTTSGKCLEERWSTKKLGLVSTKNTVQQTLSTLLRKIWVCGSPPPVFQDQWRSKTTTTMKRVGSPLCWTFWP